jgi:uncharacterized membrane protein (UPF0127 family)
LITKQITAFLFGFRCQRSGNGCRLARSNMKLSRVQFYAAASVTLLLWMPCVASSAPALELKLGLKTYNIEVADTQAKRQRGLMHRVHLAPDEGMLLTYPQAGDHRIWMKNMLIPLRVYWIDAGFEVIDVQRLEPCSSQPCPVYSVSRDSKYVLELGDYDHALAIGDAVMGIRIE